MGMGNDTFMGRIVSRSLRQEQILDHLQQCPRLALSLQKQR